MPKIYEIADLVGLGLSCQTVETHAIPSSAIQPTEYENLPCGGEAWYSAPYYSYYYGTVMHKRVCRRHVPQCQDCQGYPRRAVAMALDGKQGRYLCQEHLTEYL